VRYKVGLAPMVIVGLELRGPMRLRLIYTDPHDEPVRLPNVSTGFALDRQFRPRSAASGLVWDPVGGLPRTRACVRHMRSGLGVWGLKI
jgi:hypothetical protein